jgi:hypothetical protein
MDIIATFAPPRLCRLAGEEYWVDRFGLDDFAFLLAWLDDILPGRDDRRLPPRLSSEEAAAALDSAMSRSIHVYLALRRQGRGWGEAQEVAVQITDVEWARLRDVQYARRKTASPPGEGHGRDLAELWWGPGAAALVMDRGLTFAEVGRFTLDQWEALDPEAPGLPDEDPRRLTAEQVEAMRLAAMAAKEGEAKADG